MKVKLGDILKIKTGKLDANAASPNGKYPFFTCSVNPLRIDSYSYDCECILIAGNGDLNVKYYNGKFDAYQRTYIVENTKPEMLFLPFLYQFMRRYIETLRTQSIGGVIKYIKIGNLTNPIIDLPSVDEQKQVVSTLDTIQSLISHYKQQLELLDTLVKARFVEMFGDPVLNDKGWDTDKIKIVAPVMQAQLENNGKVWLLNLDAVEAQSGRIISYNYVGFNDVGSSTMQFDESNVLYSKLRPYLNKVVLPMKRGVCTSELLPLKPTEKLNKYFLAYLLRSDSFVAYISEKVVGAKMPRVAMKDFREFDCILPPLSLQNEFAEFVQQVEKTKADVQKSLDKTQMLFDSLMQEYFG